MGLWVEIKQEEWKSGKEKMEREDVNYASSIHLFHLKFTCVSKQYWFPLCPFPSSLFLQTQPTHKHQYEGHFMIACVSFLSGELGQNNITIETRTNSDRERLIHFL